MFFIERKGGSSSILFKVKAVIVESLKKGIKKGIKKIKTFKEFGKEQKEFKIIKKDSNKYKNVDLILLGSDTIWNLDSKYFRDNYKKYFGGIFKNKVVASYAASVANTSFEKISEYKDIPEMLEKLRYISVRDQETFSTITKLTNKKVEIVCDPTILLNKGDYKEIIKNEIVEKDYIFLYLFEKLSKKQIKSLKEFAKKRNLKIISGNNEFEYCDKEIVNVPYNFLKYMYNATYIVTDTFHGTVFSSNLEKQFIVINRKKQKVNNFLKQIGLEERIIDNSDEGIERLLEEIDYNECKEKLENIRNSSKQYLKEIIEFTVKKERKQNEF